MFCAPFSEFINFLNPRQAFGIWLSKYLCRKIVGTKGKWL